MRVPLSWLREFVDIDLTPEQLADRLTLLGMEVSSIAEKRRPNGTDSASAAV
jgi:hypothetical protein